MPCWNKCALSYRKLTCDDTIQTVAQVVTSSALSLYIVWRFLDDTCISYDIPLKRCLKGSFLLPLLTCVFPSLTISAIFISHLALPSLALLLSLWVLLWFKTTYRPHPMPPCLILIPKTCVLCSNNLMSSQKLARKFEIACHDLRSRLIRALVPIWFSCTVRFGTMPKAEVLHHALVKHQISLVIFFVDFSYI